ncbi:MAG: Arm DNA-binding domain-containing protein [Rhodanobacteraceae bacterium]
MAAKLTDVRIRQAKAKRNPYKLAAGRGLTLVVMPHGSKYWQVRYRFDGKEKLLSVGVYPEVTMQEARTKCDEARKLLRDGIDPSMQSKTDKLQRRIPATNTFGALANEWHAYNAPRWSPATTEKSRTYLEKDLLPVLGDHPIAGISRPGLVAAVRRIE